MRCSDRGLERISPQPGDEVGFSSVKFYPLWKSLTLDYIGHQFEVYTRTPR